MTADDRVVHRQEFAKEDVEDIRLRMMRDVRDTQREDDDVG